MCKSSRLISNSLDQDHGQYFSDNFCSFCSFAASKFLFMLQNLLLYVFSISWCRVRGLSAGQNHSKVVFWVLTVKIKPKGVFLFFFFEIQAPKTYIHIYVFDSLSCPNLSAVKGREIGNEKLIGFLDFQNITYRNVDARGLITGFQFLQVMYLLRNMLKITIVSCVLYKRNRDRVVHGK